jgi:hypothetical protein
MYMDVKYRYRHDSCTYVNKIDPSVDGDTPLPHLPSRVIERNGRISKIPHTPRFTKHISVEILGNIWSIHICHCPQCANYTAKTAELQSCGEVDRFIGSVVNVDCCGVTSRQEGKFGIRKSSLDQVSQRESFVVVKLKVGKEGFFRYQMAMAREMDPVALLEMGK